MGRKSDGKTVYDEEVFKMAIKLYESCEIPLEILYHLMKSKKLQSFSAIIVQSKYPDFGSFLERNKRKTDFLFRIDERQNAFAMLCQETRVDGGFYFIKRLNEVLESETGKGDIVAAIVAMESTNYTIHDLMFFMLDTYLKVLDDEEKNVIYRTIR